MPTAPNPLDVLFVLNEYSSAGADRAAVFRELLRHQPPEGTRVSVPWGARSHGAEIPCSVSRAPTFFFAPGGLGRSIWGAHLALQCRRRAPNLIVAGGIRPEGSLALEMRGRFRVPYVLHLDAPTTLEMRQEIARGGPEGREAQRILEGAEAVIVSSRACWLEVYKAGVYPHYVETIPPGVDTERFRPGEAPETLLKSLKTGRGPVLLTVAGGPAARDLETVFRAFAVVRHQRKGATLVAIGESRPWKGLLRKLKLDSAVRFVESVTAAQIPDYYRLADVFVLAHREDRDSWIAQGVESCFLESLASGLPIAATRTPATEELVADQEVGVLVEPGAHTKLGRAILDLVRSPERHTALAERAREEAEARFSSAATGRAYRDFLEVLYYRRLHRADESPSSARKESMASAIS